MPMQDYANNDEDFCEISSRSFSDLSDILIFTETFIHVNFEDEF